MTKTRFFWFITQPLFVLEKKFIPAVPAKLAKIIDWLSELFL